ncbi:hypothetical protein G3M48_001954, partial [Beauveria asiatica]
TIAPASKESAGARRHPTAHYLEIPDADDSMHHFQPKASPHSLQSQKGIERGCILGGLFDELSRAVSGMFRGEPGKRNPHTLPVLLQRALAKIAVGNRVFLTQQPLRRVNFPLSSGHCPDEDPSSYPSLVGTAAVYIYQAPNGHATGRTMGKRPLTQYQVGKDGYSVYDGDDGYGGNEGKHGRRSGQHECASDVHGEISPVPPIRRMAPPRVARQPPAATRREQEPTKVKEVVALRAPLEENPWAKNRYEKAYVTQDFDGDATVAVGAQRVVLIRQFPRPDQHTVQLYSPLVATAETTRGLTGEANQEKLIPLTGEIEARDAAAVGEVALHLMQKDAGPGVRDSAQWHAFLNFVAHAASANGVAQLRGDPILANMSPGHERSVVALYYTAEVASLKLYKIAEDPSKASPMLQFRRLVRRHSLVGPFYTCKVLVYAFVFALNAAVLSLETTRTETSAFSVRLATLSDAAARAKYLALLNLTVTCISPHHYGVADVFGLSLQLFQQ